MDEFRLEAVPLTAERFAPYGDVIETGRGVVAAMNDARFERFDNLAAVNVDGRVALGIVRCRTPSSLPYRFDMVERHPLGSQAFIPRTPFRFAVVVGPPGETVAREDLRAFVTNGRQGINYHRGTWHMPLIAFEREQEFLVVDRAGADNCEELVFDEPVLLVAP